MNPRKPTIKPRDVQGAQYLEQIVALLRPLHAHRPDPKRSLHYDELCAWLLLYFFSPILTSLRALQQASTLEQLQRQFKLPRFSLGSFSESAAVFDPKLLVPIMEQLGEQLSDIEPDERLRALERRPTAVDGSLLHALPKRIPGTVYSIPQPDIPPPHCHRRIRSTTRSSGSTFSSITAVPTRSNCSVILW